MRYYSGLLARSGGRLRGSGVSASGPSPGWLAGHTRRLASPRLLSFMLSFFLGQYTFESWFPCFIFQTSTLFVSPYSVHFLFFFLPLLPFTCSCPPFDRHDKGWRPADSQKEQPLTDRSRSNTVVIDESSPGRAIH